MRKLTHAVWAKCSLNASSGFARRYFDRSFNAVMTSSLSIAGLRLHEEWQICNNIYLLIENIYLNTHMYLHKYIFETKKGAAAKVTQEKLASTPIREG